MKGFKLRPSYLLLAVMITAVFATSCSDDDDEDAKGKLPVEIVEVTNRYDKDSTVISFSYDAKNRLSRINGCNFHFSGYDNTYYNPSISVSVYEYDKDDRLTRVGENYRNIENLNDFEYMNLNYQDNKVIVSFPYLSHIPETNTIYLDAMGRIEKYDAPTDSYYVKKEYKYDSSSNMYEEICRNEASGLIGPVTAVRSYTYDDKKGIFANVKGLWWIFDIPLYLEFRGVFKNNWIQYTSKDYYEKTGKEGKPLVMERKYTYDNDGYPIQYDEFTDGELTSTTTIKYK